MPERTGSQLQEITQKGNGLEAYSGQAFINAFLNANGNQSLAFLTARFLAAAFLLRTSALFAAAFCARFVRSLALNFFAAVLPPLLPCFLKNSSTSGGSSAIVGFRSFE